MDVLFIPFLLSFVILLVNLLISRRVHRRNLRPYRSISLMSVAFLSLWLGLLPLLALFANASPDVIGIAADTRWLAGHLLYPVLLFPAQLIFNRFLLPRRMRNS